MGNIRLITAKMFLDPVSHGSQMRANVMITVNPIFSRLPIDFVMRLLKFKQN